MHKQRLVVRVQKALTSLPIDLPANQVLLWCIGFLVQRLVPTIERTYLTINPVDAAAEAMAADGA